MMLPSEAMRRMNNDIEKVVREESLSLYASLIAVSPVDTGYYRSSWSFHKITKLSFKLSNSVNYASILARGRRYVDGQMRGSIQWPEGLAPMLLKTNVEMKRKFDAIRY